MASRRQGGAVAGSRERPGRNAARRQLLDALFTAGRELSAAAVMFHTALAARQGLTATEEKALDLLDRYGPLTGRQLAERSGLAPAMGHKRGDGAGGRGFAPPPPQPGRRPQRAYRGGPGSPGRPRPAVHRLGW